MTPSELKARFPNASASTLRRNAPVFSRDEHEAISLYRQALDKKRLRQSAKGPNKWEAEYASVMRSRGFQVWEKPMRLRLGNGVTYEPDIMACRWNPNVDIELHEVKGHMRDDAAVKLKVAASLYPCFQWFLAWREKGEWKTQRILP